MQGESRGKFTSSFGFILAATGSAVGLGNLWKFPYVAGENGGAIFLLFYLLFAIILGVPLFMSEMAIGRRTRLNPIGAYRSLNKRFTFVGVIGVVAAFVILSYYSVIGGWVIKYILTYITNTSIIEPVGYYTGFISSSIEPLIMTIIFVVISSLIVMSGVAKGIEKASKIMLPALFVLILAVAIRSLFLPNAIEGIKYFLVPDISEINSFSKLSKIMLAAMGQVFFSFSLGMGAMITYGSYLKSDADIKKSALIIPVLDTVIALLAGFAILPAVFSFSLPPQAGEGLLFETLPMVFNSMVGGKIFGLLFFVLVLFAAITSAVSLFEVITSYLIDHFKWSRSVATIVVMVLIAAAASVVSLSYGVLSDIRIFSMGMFEALSFLSDKLLMPIGGLFCSIFVGYIWGIDNVAMEITNQGALAFKRKKLFAVAVKFVAPALIGIVFLVGLMGG